MEGAETMPLFDLTDEELEFEELSLDAVEAE
jgi:hypothetical protein